MEEAMSEIIEHLDRKRRRLLKIHVLGAVVYFSSWLTRFILRETGALPEWLDRAIVVPFVVGLGILVYSFWGILRIRKAVESDPAVRAALNDERVRLSNLSAFKYGFFAMMGGLAFFAVFHFISPIQDVIGVMITLFMVGAWGYLLAFYKLERD
jgi:hypothetical protein